MLTYLVTRALRERRLRRQSGHEVLVPLVGAVALAHATQLGHELGRLLDRLHLWAREREWRVRDKGWDACVRDRRDLGSRLYPEGSVHWGAHAHVCSQVDTMPVDRARTHVEGSTVEDD